MNNRGRAGSAIKRTRFECGLVQRGRKNCHAPRCKAWFNRAEILHRNGSVKSRLFLNERLAYRIVR
jgi:hypothetical protein